MDFPLTIAEYILSLVIISTGSLLQGSVGFGMGLFSVPLLILIDSNFVPGPLLLTAFFLNLLVMKRERKATEYFSLKWVLAGRFIGTIIGATLLVIIPQNFISILFGILIFLGVFFSLGGFHLSLTARNMFGVGSLSGFMATTTAIGGPPLALLFQRESGRRLRGNLAGIFFVGALLSIFSLIVIGRFSVNEITLAVSLLPGIFFGFLLSNWTAKILDRGFTRLAVLIVSAISAGIVILKSI
jgi:uncharacterized membrane protein YfcA